MRWPVATRLREAGDDGSRTCTAVGSEEGRSELAAAQARRWPEAMGGLPAGVRACVSCVGGVRVCVLTVHVCGVCAGVCGVCVLARPSPSAGKI
jgi:hypothetical protein